MKLDYGTLISISPLELQNGLSIRSPLLKEISKLTFPVYQFYLGILLLDIESYYNGIDQTPLDYDSKYSKQEKELINKIRQEYESLNEEEKEWIQPIDIISFDTSLLNNIGEALSFFLNCRLYYSHDHQAFVHVDHKKIVYTLPKSFYTEIADLILQRNGIIRSITNHEKPKFKSKLAEKLYYRTKQAEKNREKSRNTDKNMDLPNIISAVAARHHSLNILNIWDITVYQLYDQFQRLQNNTLYDIQSMSVAAWGDDKNNFDATQWYKNLNIEN
jgi:hypothetical protein